MTFTTFAPAVASNPTSIFSLPVEAETMGDLGMIKPLISRGEVTTLVYGNISPVWKLVEPLQINIDLDDNGSFVVSDDLFLVYGNGRTTNEAIIDYVGSLLEFYELVRVGAETNRYDQEQLVILQSYLKHL